MKRFLNSKIMTLVLVVVMVFAMSATAFADTSTVNVNELQTVSDRVETREFNQWERSSANFTFDVSSQKKTKKALGNALLVGGGTAIGLLGGNGGAIAGSMVGAFFASYASDCIEENYAMFGKVGYGTVFMAKYKSKLRVSVYIYSDAARTKLVYKDTYATDNFL